MQLTAHDENATLILAAHAKKRKNYYCVECKGIVRLRKGPERRPHFFHHHPNKLCSTFSRSWTHLQIQLHILNLLPKGEAFIEKPYPQIQRIADVAWISEGIVFEIQCSPISLIECQERNEAYLSIGLTPIWILYDKKFNRKALSAAEKHLRRSLAFFAGFRRNNQCFIYDQYEIIKYGKRWHRSLPIPVDLSRPLRRDNSLSFFGALSIRSTPAPLLNPHPSQPPALMSRLYTILSHVSKNYGAALYSLLDHCR